MNAYHAAAGLLILAIVLALVGIHAAGQTIRGAKHMAEWPTDEYEAIKTFAGEPPPLPRRIVRPHSECVDTWADGKAPCGRCERILGVRA